MRKILIILVVNSFFNLNFFGQEGHYILDDYDVIENIDEVFINVTVSSGYTCKGIKVWKSEDEINFQYPCQVRL